MTNTAKTAAILGAGVAGLVTAKMLRQYGLDVTVYEAKPELGGVWANNYKSLSVLEPYNVYGFPDWPWSDGTPVFPTAQNVRDYLTDYAHHFEIYDSINFNSRVLNAQPTNEGHWLIEVDHGSNIKSNTFDYFIMAPGMFNLAKIPKWPGVESFSGEVIHTSQFRDVAQIQNKNVVVIGFSRSAMDVAIDAVGDARSTTILHRSVRWPVPEKILGVIPNHLLLFSRWPTLFVPPWIRPSPAAKMLHNKGSVIVNLFWKFFEFLLRSQFRLKRRNLTPDRPIKLDLFTNLYITPRNFFAMVGNSTIKSVRSEIESFGEKEIYLSSGQTVAADVVIYGTGWSQDYSFLPTNLLERIYDEDGMHLYRHIIHPDLPGFAFVGSVQGINSATCYAIQATWVARYLTGNFSLPSSQKQLEEIESLKTWNRALVTKRPNRSQILNLHQLPYIDELMDDMGIKKQRKSRLVDLVAPYQSLDYRTVVDSVLPK